MCSSRCSADTGAIGLRSKPGNLRTRTFTASVSCLLNRAADLLPFQWHTLHQTLKLRPMRRCKLIMVAVAIAAVCLIPDLPVIAAQDFGFWRGPVIQNTPPPTE